MILWTTFISIIISLAFLLRTQKNDEVVCHIHISFLAPYNNHNQAFFLDSYQLTNQLVLSYVYPCLTLYTHYQSYVQLDLWTWDSQKGGLGQLIIQILASHNASGILFHRMTCCIKGMRFGVPRLTVGMGKYSMQLCRMHQVGNTSIYNGLSTSLFNASRMMFYQIISAL